MYGGYRRTLREEDETRMPTNNNPMMNVPITAYDTPQSYDYYRYEKQTYPTSEDLRVKKSVDNKLNHNLIKDPDSFFWNRINSEREFVSKPIGDVINDQGAFAEWLYGIKNNCKHGSIFMKYGVETTPDSMLCTGFNAQEPTNFGMLSPNFMSSVEGGNNPAPFEF